MERGEHREPGEEGQRRGGEKEEEERRKGGRGGRGRGKRKERRREGRRGNPREWWHSLADDHKVSGRQKEELSTLSKRTRNVPGWWDVGMGVGSGLQKAHPAEHCSQEQCRGGHREDKVAALGWEPTAMLRGLLATKEGLIWERSGHGQRTPWPGAKPRSEECWPLAAPLWGQGGRDQDRAGAGCCGLHLRLSLYAAQSWVPLQCQGTWGVPARPPEQLVG